MKSGAEDLAAIIEFMAVKHSGLMAPVLSIFLHLLWSSS